MQATPTTPPNAGYISYVEAAKLYPVPPDPGTVYRHMVNGVRARNGQRIYLRHISFGKTRYTRPEWVTEFGEAKAAADRQTTPERPSPAPRRRRTNGQQQARRVERIVAAMK